MNENEKANVNGEENNYFETVNNELPEGVKYDVFSENITESRKKAEDMNRDYLKHIYKEDMEFLNKDVRMTRTGYLRDLDTVEKAYEKETKHAKIRLVLHTVIFVVAVAFAIYFCDQWIVYSGLYEEITNFIRFNTEATHDDGELRRAYWAASGLYGSLAVISFCVGTAQFIFFTVSNVRALKLAKRIREKAIRNIEGRKKECMLLGQYDASR